MKISVLGGGVVGVCAGYFLARDGHEVTIHERRDALATEASWGNGGLISPSDAYAWASPAALKMAVRSLYRSDLGIKYQIRLDPRLWLWSLKFLTQCTSAAARRNTAVKFRLLRYSLDTLNRIVADTGIRYDGLSGGILYYFRTEAGIREGASHAALLREMGLPIEVLDRAGLVKVEPMMARVPNLAGGLYSPTCQTGDSNLFAVNLAAWARDNLGLRIDLGRKLTRIVAEGGRVAKVESDRGDIIADAYVLAAGAESVFLGESAGLKLPIYPVKGYSATLPVRDPARIPGRAIVDEDKLIAITPMGDRLRATASAVFGGFDRSHRPEDFATIRALVGDLFGDAVRLGRGAILDRIPADDPALGADPGPVAPVQPVPRYRPRPCRLVDVRRLGPVRRRYRRRARARDRYRRTDDRPDRARRDGMPEPLDPLELARHLRSLRKIRRGRGGGETMPGRSLPGHRPASERRRNSRLALGPGDQPGPRPPLPGGGRIGRRPAKVTRIRCDAIKLPEHNRCGRPPRGGHSPSRLGFGVLPRSPGDHWKARTGRLPLRRVRGRAGRSRARNGRRPAPSGRPPGMPPRRGSAATAGW